MAGIDLGHEQGNIGLHAMVARIRDYKMARGCKRAFDLGGDRCVHGRKNKLRCTSGFGIADCDFGGCCGHVAFEAPSCRVLNFFPGGAVARAQPSKPEPGMSLQKADEVLANHASSTEDANFNRSHSIVFIERAFRPFAYRSDAPRAIPFLECALRSCGPRGLCRDQLKTAGPTLQ